MRRHLNTLFVTLEGAYIRKDGEAVEIRHEGQTKLRVPLHNLDGIVYFAVFAQLLVNHDPACTMTGRSRRPPLDPVNALLSFLYSLLMHDCRSALESCGLDAQCGMLHRDRPGRPSLALDLMEEFRAFLADRTALTLLNRHQITAADFKP